MKHRWLLGLFLMAQAPQPTTTTKPVLTVSLPLNINPETVTLEAGVYARGMSLTTVW